MGDLRERLARALTAPSQCRHPGAESCDVWWRADAALAAVAAWLRELAAEQWKRAGTGFDPAWQERAAMRAMYLTERALELEGDEPHDRTAALMPDTEEKRHDG